MAHYRSHKISAGAIEKDVYKVQFYDVRGGEKKRYKLLLENGDQRIKANINENVEFQD